MSNSDSFIDEVTEEVRRDQLFQMLRRYGWIAVLVVVVLVGGTAWNEFRKARTEAEAQATGDAILAALEVADPQERATALSGLEAGGGSAAVAGLLAAADLETAGDVEGAAGLLTQLSTNGDLPAIYRDLATLKLAMLPRGATSAEDRRALLSGIAAPGAPLRMVALEQLALIEVETGNADGAIEQFRAIAQDAEASRGLRDRAVRMIIALGGDVADLAQDQQAGQ